MAAGVEKRGFRVRIIPRHHQLIFPHLPGHGTSHINGKPFSFEDLSDDFAFLHDHLGLDSAHLVGWCMASNISQLMAHRHPDRIKTLTPVC